MPLFDKFLIDIVSIMLTANISEKQIIKLVQLKLMILQYK